MSSKPADPVAQAIARGDLAAAERLARERVRTRPRDGAALALLGHVLRRRQNDAAALEQLAQALERKPELGAAWKDVAIIHLRANRAAEALHAATEAARLLAQDPWNQFLLGHALALNHRFDQAEAAFARAVRAGGRPLQEARLALAQDATARGDAQGALFHAQAGVDAAPQAAAAWYTLGTALSALERHDEALPALRQACALAPRNAEYLQTLARLLELTNQLGDELIELRRRVVALEPDAVAPLQSLGLAQIGAHQGEAARATFAKIAQLQPGNLLARWIDFQLAPRPWFDSEDERAAFFAHWQRGLADFEGADLERLADPALREQARAVLGSVPNFGLAYLGGANVELHQRLARVLRRLLEAATGAPIADAPIRRIGSKRRRVAIVSRCLRSHSVTRAWGEALLALPREDFELCVLYTDRFEDAVSARFRERAEHYASGRRDFFAWSSHLRELAPDIVVFLDIGMDVVNQSLASVRFAPVQIATWAHPVTTGMQTIDYFVSADLAEPAEANAHYSERLIRLPRLGGCFALPTEAPLARIEGGPPRFMCSQFLIKLHPRHDALFAQIANACPAAEFTLLTNGESHQTAAFKERVQRALTQRDVDPRRFRILPRVGVDAYRAELAQADVLLDSLDFSGGLTSLDTLWQERPLVTLPGELMRGRQSYAMLRRLGIDATVAADEADYVRIASELALNADRRHAVQAQLAERKHALFEDREVCTAFADFLRNVEAPGISA